MLDPAVKERHPWYAGRRRILATTLDALAVPAGARVLDAGCGAGGNLALLRSRGYDAVGVDPDPRAVAAAGPEAAVGSVLDLPFADGTFDLVCCLDVLEHVDDERRALAELRRVGRALLVTVPAFPGLWSSHDVAAGHVRRYSRASLIRAAAGAGWRPERVWAFNSLLLPVVAARRLGERLRPVAPRSDLLRSPRFAGPLVGAALGCEARLLRRGVHAPVGLSLIGVFR